MRGFIYFFFLSLSFSFAYSHVNSSTNYLAGGEQRKSRFFCEQIIFRLLDRVTDVNEIVCLAMKSMMIYWLW